MLNYEKDDILKDFKMALMRAIAEVDDLDHLKYLHSKMDKGWVSLVRGVDKKGKKIRERYELTFRRVG